MAVNEELLAIGDNTLDREGGNNMELIASSRVAAEAEANQRLNDTLYDTANDTIAAGEVLVDMDHDQTQILGENPGAKKADLNDNETQVLADRVDGLLEEQNELTSAANALDQTRLEKDLATVDGDSTQVIVKKDDTDIPNG